VRHDPRLRAGEGGDAPFLRNSNRAYIAQNIKLVRIQGLFEPHRGAHRHDLPGVLWSAAGRCWPANISVGSLISFNTLTFWAMLGLVP